MSAASSANARYITLGSWQFKVWQLVVVALIILIAVFTALWWFNHFERVSKTSYQLTERANYNPYFAAELLLQQRHGAKFSSDISNDASNDTSNDANNSISNDASKDVNADIDIDVDVDVDKQDAKPFVQTLLDDDIKTLVDRLDELPPIDASDASSDQQPALRPVLLINSISTQLSQARFMALQQWVEQGGHLITFAGNGIKQEAFNDVLALMPPASDKDNDSDKDSDNDDIEAQALKRLTELNVGNQFLAQLGIVAVQQTGCQDTDCSGAAKQSADIDSADIDEALARLETQYGINIDPETGELQSGFETADKATSESASPQHKLTDEATAFKRAIERLTTTQSLALINTPDYGVNAPNNTPNNTPNNASPFSETMLLKNITPNVAINYTLFQQRYPESIASPLASTQALKAPPKQQANTIRHYLQRELAQFEASQPLPAAASRDKNSDKKSDASKASQSAAEKMGHMVTWLLTLDDATLIALFAPATQVYLDVPFKKGRISVLKERTIFSNPDPNTDLANLANLDDATTKASQWTPLLELLDNDSYLDISQNLYDADNAKLLVALTQQASEVWILPNSDVDPLPVLLWRHARIAVLGLGLLLLIWLWALYNRFGKQRALPPMQANNILRYFYQVGRYGWDVDRATTLVNLSRQQSRAALYDYLAKISTADSGLAAVRDVLQQAALNHQSKIIQPSDAAEVTHRKMGSNMNSNMNSYAPKPNNAGSYNNPLALLTAKELTRVSTALIAQYHKKATMNKQFNTNTMDKDLGLDKRMLADAEQVFSSERLSAALIQPLSHSHSAQTLSDITQTLWLLNWVLR